MFCPCSRSEASEAVVDEKLPPSKRCNAMPRNSTALDVQSSIHRIAYSPSFSKNVENLYDGESFDYNFYN